MESPAKREVKLDEDDEKTLKAERKAAKKRKKEKQERSTAVALFGKTDAKRLRMTKEKLEELAEIEGEFKVDLPNLIEMVDDGLSAEEVQKAYLRSALVTVINLIPRMEEVALHKKNESGAYALNALLSQGREIISDLRALESADEVALRIATLVIDPAFQAIAANIVTTFSSIKDDITMYVPEEHAFKMRQVFQTHASNLGQLLDMARVTMKERISEMIE